MTFYLYTDVTGQESVVMVDGETIWFVPMDEANTDYQAYLAWVNEGNTPEPWNPAP